MDRQVVLNRDSAAVFQNHASFCIGTGRMALALHEEYARELSFVQEKMHFTHIRGHGLLSDDMAIYRPYTDEKGVVHEAYCFTYLDRVMDLYQRLGLRPFLEIGFMPQNLASGTQTIFYWKGNVTPPADDEKWIRLIRAVMTHLKERYGEEEVSLWPCEIWNEPNLPNFWENMDRDKYLHLYEITALAIREVLPGMQVGGPAVCGCNEWEKWIEVFLTYCRDRHLPLDMVTRHIYMGQTPRHQGDYLYHDMCEPSFSIAELEKTRRIIDSFPEYRGMPLHITEFSTSYNPRCPIHDTNRNSALIAGLLAKMGDYAASYSYWTFGDVFEETGVPARLFHGGFGLTAAHCIPKPTFWTFTFFNRLKGSPVYRDDHMVLLKNGACYEGVCWNHSDEPVNLTLEIPEKETYVMSIKRVDEECCNPLKAWHLMGEKASLSEEETEFLKMSAQPRTEVCHVNGKCDLLLKKNTVLSIQLKPYSPETEYGYDYGWYES